MKKLRSSTILPITLAAAIMSANFSGMNLFATEAGVSENTVAEAVISENTAELTGEEVENESAARYTEIKENQTIPVDCSTAGMSYDYQVTITDAAYNGIYIAS